MFLFLSKLLPLFVYPLGLACILLFVTFVLVWWRPRWSALFTATALILLLAASNGWTSLWLVRSLEWRHLPQGELPEASAIVVLGGATRSQLVPRPWVDVMEAGDRILYAAKLYKEEKAPKIILSGGRIDWRGSGAPESKDMAEILELLDIPRSAILQDPTSLNTYQNAVNVRQVMQEENIAGNVLLVTSAIHMPRSLAVFKKQAIEAIAAPTDFLVTRQAIAGLSDTWQSAVLNALPDAENLQHTTRALKEYLGLAVYYLRRWL